MRNKFTVHFLCMVLCTVAVFSGCNSRDDNPAETVNTTQSQNTEDENNENNNEENNNEEQSLQGERKTEMDSEVSDEQEFPSNTLQIENMSGTMKEKTEEILEKADELVEKMKEGN